MSTSHTRRPIRTFVLAGVLALAPGASWSVATAGEASAAVAVSSAPAADSAVAWARSQLGSAGYQGLCQAFVEDAYELGAGVDIGSAASAVDYWNAHPDRQHPGDLQIPSGALVFWGATDTNPYGHVAISEGGDLVISSEERSTTTVHEFSVADRNSGPYPYLGWLLPA
jgi:cell wall-associated NlpC family hydrolase